ncbi:hypothetical protein I633_04465 [Alteromonas mediterranea 615]|uniref:Serine protease n=1 Tax=Alteromonas mediterranea 615 TaxID=1300253 RepID=S5ABP1_9ALTE|nr:hypothetical protein I633_04465 [Alteromonas mediterranea 615]
MARVLLFFIIFGLSFKLQSQTPFLFPQENWGKPFVLSHESTVQLESLFNQRADNFEIINQFSKFNSYKVIAKAIGRLDLKVTDINGTISVTYCTASVISERYILTNDHCINPRGLEVSEIKLRMGLLTIDENSFTEYAVSTSPIENSKTLDYAILEVEGNPSEKFGTIKLNIAKSVSDGEELFILHHPLAKPLRLTRKDCRTRRVNSISGNSLRHLCDTLPGSSGAPVFSDLTKSIVGIHYAGGLSNADASSFNSAISIVKIMERSEVLQSLLDQSVLQSNTTDLDRNLESEKSEESLAVENTNPILTYQNTVGEMGGIAELSIISPNKEKFDAKFFKQTIALYSVFDYNNVKYTMSNAPYIVNSSYGLADDFLFTKSEGCLFDVDEVIFNLDPLSLEEVNLFTSSGASTGGLNLAYGGVKFSVSEQTDGYRLSFIQRPEEQRYLQSVDFVVNSIENLNKVLLQISSLTKYCGEKVDMQRRNAVRASLNYRTQTLADLIQRQVIPNGNIEDIEYEVCSINLKKPYGNIGLDFYRENTIEIETQIQGYVTMNSIIACSGPFRSPISVQSDQ